MEVINIFSTKRSFIIFLITDLSVGGFVAGIHPGVSNFVQVSGSGKKQSMPVRSQQVRFIVSRRIHKSSVCSHTEIGSNTYQVWGGPEVGRLAGMAGKYKIFLVMGVIEREGYTLYCSVLFFDHQGQYLGKHRKLMPTALERVIWGFGDGSTIPVYQTPIGKIGALICWENRMPLLRTALYGKGIEIFCAPTADAREVWQASMTHIALEGGCFVLSANQFCRRKDYPPPPDYVFAGADEEPSPDTVVCAGGSVIISPSGVVLAGPNYEGEALISADLDMGEIVRAKFDFDVVGHYSRPEVLSLTVKDHPQNAVSFTYNDQS